MEWSKHAQHWPMAEHSRFVRFAPHLWHIQEAGEGPLLLLLHGAGGATQSWRHLFPLLVQEFRVVAIDLPGQGFTKMGVQDRCGLVEMSQDILALCGAEGWEPTAIIGHSAGGAIALQMAVLLGDASVKIIGINPALEPFRGVAGVLFPLLAKTLLRLPFASQFLSSNFGTAETVEKLIAGTGSVLEHDDLQFYRVLFRDSGHVSGTLRMMGSWDLAPLNSALRSLHNRVTFLLGDLDKTVAPRAAIARMVELEFGSCRQFEGVGHLMHEESPVLVFDAIHAYLAE